MERGDEGKGEWSDRAESGKRERSREVRYDSDERRAIAESTKIKGDVGADVERDLKCPKCGEATDAINYGGDTGIVIDRCTGCRGFWLDDGELEKIQMVIEGWEDALPEDLKKYEPKLRDVAVEVDKADDVTISRLPLIGGFINSAINGILDLMD